MPRGRSPFAAALIALVMGAGCGSADEPPGSPSSAGSSNSTGSSNPADSSSCACSATPDRRSVVSLECYCSVATCPTYEEALGYGLGLCSASFWPATRQDGCGQIIIGSNGGLGGVTYVFDAGDHELLGVSSSSDTAIDACGNSSVVAGLAPSCREGSRCSRCSEQTEACAEACSIEAYEKTPEGAGVRFELIKSQFCEGLAPADRPRLTTGCGGATLQYGSRTVVFDELSQELIAVSDDAAFAESAPCAGQWGEAPPACDTQVSCSLCQEDADRCEL